MARSFDAAWPDVNEWVDDASPHFNRIVAALWAVLDPEAVILGGQIHADLAERLIARISLTEINRYGMSRPKPRLLISELGPPASSIGAAAYALEQSCS